MNILKDNFYQKFRTISEKIFLVEPFQSQMFSHKITEFLRLFFRRAFLMDTILQNMESRLLKLLTIDLSEKIFSKEFSKEFRYQVYLCWLIFLLPKLLSSSKKFVNFVTQKDVLLISLFQYLNLNFTSKIRKWVSDTNSEILHSCQTEV